MQALAVGSHLQHKQHCVNSPEQPLQIWLVSVKQGMHASLSKALGCSCTDGTTWAIRGPRIQGRRHGNHRVNASYSVDAICLSNSCTVQPNGCCIDTATKHPPGEAQPHRLSQPEVAATLAVPCSTRCVSGRSGSLLWPSYQAQ